MFARLPNRHDVSLTVTPISLLQAGTFVNIGGTVSQAFQQPRITRVHTHFLSVSLQGILIPLDLLYQLLSAKLII